MIDVDSYILSQLYVHHDVHLDGKTTNAANGIIIICIIRIVVKLATTGSMELGRIETALK